MVTGKGFLQAKCAGLTVMERAVPLAQQNRRSVCLCFCDVLDCEIAAAWLWLCKAGAISIILPMLVHTSHLNILVTLWYSSARTEQLVAS